MLTQKFFVAFWKTKVFSVVGMKKQKKTENFAFWWGIFEFSAVGCENIPLKL